MGMDFRLAEDCRLIRNTLGLTQQQLAAALGVEYPTISLWENGKMTPSFSSLDRLYSFTYSKGFNLSETKGQFYLEEKSETKLSFSMVRTRASFGRLALPIPERK